MTKLTKLLEYETATNSERKKMAGTSAFKTLVLDTLQKSKKELLISNAEDSSELLRESVYDTIVAGAEPARCMRDAFPVIPIGDHQCRVTYVSGAAVYADRVAEGAAIPINVDKFDTVTITPYKIGVRPLITDEMIEDGLWDMVEWHLKWAGRAIENKFNRDVLDAFIGGVTTTAATGAGSMDNIITNRGTVEEQGWLPDKMVISPGFEEDLLLDDNFNQAQMYGNNSITQTGRIGNILGLDVKRLSVIGGETYTWGGGFDAASEYGCLIYDSTAPVMMIGMKRDITSDEYKDPIHGLVGIAATMRFGVEVIHQKAGLAWKQA